ncbi:MAG: glycosyltransferase family 2 protein [Synergistaceae bacterium]|nr:glycosyltransferase family 2 protein [Synergistaceae bacterium]
MRTRSLSIVVPVFNEEDNVAPLFWKIKEVLEEVAFEVIFVDDASTDSTLSLLVQLNSRFPKEARYISFARNFGHQTAIRAGLLCVRGDCAVTMDGDFQHPPELIPHMLRLWREGYEIVNARRKHPRDIGYFKKITSTLFYKMNNTLTEFKLEEGVADFRLMDRKIVEHVNGLSEDNLFLRGIVAWLGFRQCCVDYEQPGRMFGASKYTLKKMFGLALSGVTSFSVKPLRLALAFGCVFSALSFLYGFYAIAIYFKGQSLPGWASVLVSGLFIGGIQLICLGIMGEYVAKIHMQVKNRPLFVVKARSCERSDCVGGADGKTD